MSDLSYANLRCHYQTGRSYVVSGEGRNRVYGYRNGIQCNLGDIEQKEWCQMVKEVIQREGEQEVIQREGEQELYKQLLQHLKDHNYAKESNRELEFKALQLHASRIFDNEAWVDFLKFNWKYRPEIASSARLVWIIPECCKRPGEVTQVLLESHKHIDNRACCPHCGRWVRFKFYTTRVVSETQ